jgi:hypothetical protein
MYRDRLTPRTPRTAGAARLAAKASTGWLAVAQRVGVRGGLGEQAGTTVDSSAGSQRVSRDTLGPLAQPLCAGLGGEVAGVRPGPDDRADQDATS